MRIRLVALLTLSLLAPAQAAELPRATQRDLAELGLAASVLDGLDAELAVPAGWIVGAKREGRVRIIGTWDAPEQARLAAPFRERYPFLDIAYTPATERTQRSVRVLTALMEGRVLADVISGLGSAVFAFRDAGALMPLGDLPAFRLLPPELSDPDARWAGHQLNYWCLAYNKARVRPETMPQDWNDLLEAGRWGGGRIGLGNRPNLWLLPLLGARGEGWARDFARRLFAELAPQRRKEGMNALIKLVSLGEFELALPVAQTRLASDTGRGAAIGWHCPAPVPIAVQTIAILKATPAPDAARLFVNWLLSREGQIALYRGTGGSPTDAALEGAGRFAYAAAIAGKARAVRAPSLLEEQEWPALQAYWDGLWSQ